MNERRYLGVLLTASLLACTHGERSASKQPSQPPQVLPATARPVTAEPPSDAEETTRDKLVPPRLDRPRTTEVWPFQSWTRAEVMTFNRFRPRRGDDVRIYVVSDKGWSPHIESRKELLNAQSKQALELLAVTEGEALVSKCPFPRHAVVLYDKEVPVGSINVCFECGDILVWPRWSEEEEPPENASDEDLDRYAAKQELQMRRYDEVFPRWQALFRDELGLSITPP